MSAAPTIFINGYDLNSRFRISELKRPFSASRVTTETVPGMDGEVVMEQTMGSRYVSFRLWAHSTDHSALYEDMAELATLLLMSSELVLSISDENGRSRKVVLDGELDFDEYEERGSVLIKLKQPDPLCVIGNEKTATIPSGGSLSLSFSHDSPTITIDSLSAVRDSASLVWGLRFDDGDVLYVKLPDSSPHVVSIECDSRSVTVDGDASMITLSSDWPYLKAGIHEISMDEGTGSATITWQERCL